MRYGPIETGDDEQVGEILGAAFAFPPEEAGEWIARSGRENARVVHDGSTPVAAHLQIPMGHFFGGRPVSAVGIAGVGVALEARGGHIAKAMMRSCIQELANRKVALSSLYASTQTLYRRVGYELAGKTTELSIRLDRIETTVSADGLTIRRLGEDDKPRIEDLYRSTAPETNGALDRGPYIWRRVYEPRGKKVRGFGFFDGDRLEAYLYVAQHRSDPSSPRHDLWATDFRATTARGYAAIFAFARRQRSVADELGLYSVPSAPYLSLLTERCYDETCGEDWLVRVCDVEAALTARGYSAFTTASVSFRLQDEIVAANDGVWTLSLERGKARIARGGTPAASLDVRAFAQLYTGYATAAALARMGLIDGSREAALALDAIFTAPMPAMADRF
ncbi:MAG: GNAT family N-acetyltransferase [Polyangiaceae bacterium]|nr:GNAT family N-acetyltransferase [Polyangiaceae bacterium]